MERWSWMCWCRAAGDAAGSVPPPEPLLLPAPMPKWPNGKAFAGGELCIGELEVIQITKFERVWNCFSSKLSSRGAAFYKPSELPEGYHCLGYYGQQNNQTSRNHPFRGFLLAAKDVSNNGRPGLEKPLDYILVWSSYSMQEDDSKTCGCFWLPRPPEGYKAVGYVVTAGTTKPSVETLRCVRADLTESCEKSGLIIDMESISPDFHCQVWQTRPCHRGMHGRGVMVGTFFCNTGSLIDDEMSICCLRNLDSSLQAMPNLEQIHALISHYGPTLFFHPKEIYLPSSVSWFFQNGAMLHEEGGKGSKQILSDGSNLPLGGSNDGKYWIDLPKDNRNDYIKLGNLDNAELYVHVKPASGGTFTDLAMWVFCPFNGPATLKIGIANFPMSKIGQHVSDWEHYTLRISNFTGELWSIYFSQHSGGEWVGIDDLEFISGNRAVVYSSKSGHASYPHAGTYLQGSEKLGVGIRNDAARSTFSVDSSTQYSIVAAEYLGNEVLEPCWLQFMREWGPTIRYNSREELDKILRVLPASIRHSVENVLNSLPSELSGEEGPSGPKEKNNWEGDERW